MENSNSNGCLGLLLSLAPIAYIFGSGYIAWNWVEPNSFITTLVFLVAWGIVGFILRLIIVGIVVAISES